MKVTNLLATKRVTTPISISRDPTEEDEMDAISLQMKLFNALATTYGKDGKLVADQKKLMPPRYKRLSHVLNTIQRL